MTFYGQLFTMHLSILLAINCLSRNRAKVNTDFRINRLLFPYIQQLERDPTCSSFNWESLNRAASTNCTAVRTTPDTHKGYKDHKGVKGDRGNSTHSDCKEKRRQLQHSGDNLSASYPCFELNKSNRTSEAYPQAFTVCPASFPVSMERTIRNRSCQVRTKLGFEPSYFACRNNARGIHEKPDYS